MVFSHGVWLNPRAAWHEDCADLHVTIDARTDFWRSTHYGFTRDTGHFLGFATDGDFTAQVRVRAQYTALYDQAGIMVRLDEARWLKAGIELADGQPMLGSVLTLGQSHWATGAYAGDAGDIWYG